MLDTHSYGVALDTMVEAFQCAFPISYANSHLMDLVGWGPIPYLTKMNLRYVYASIDSVGDLLRSREPVARGVLLEGVPPQRAWSKVPYWA